MPGTSQDLDAARAFYTRISSVYDALADRDEHVARQTGLTLLDAQAGEHVLEIGFGTGSSLAGLATAVGASGRVCGIDISPGMKAVAEQRLRSTDASATVDLRVAAVPPIPFGDTAFAATFTASRWSCSPTTRFPRFSAKCVERFAWADGLPSCRWTWVRPSSVAAHPSASTHGCTVTSPTSLTAVRSMSSNVLPKPGSPSSASSALKSGDYQSLRV